MRRRWLAVVVTGVAVVGLGYVHPFGNPRAKAAKGSSAISLDDNMPAAARAVLMTKCADCHSAQTRWPAYARIAPGSWLIERDIVQARKKMDLSHWDELPADTREVLAAKIIRIAKSGDMPPLQYRILHWGAKLSSADVKALSLLASKGAEEENSAGPGDAVRGKLVFEKRCTGCHATDTNREGPKLGDVYGRKAGSVPGFDYSSALKKTGITWTDATLERWLTDPDVMVPGNNMEFHVPKVSDRRDLIAHLKAMKASLP